jgi:hypothetical protein
MGISIQHTRRLKESLSAGSTCIILGNGPSLRDSIPIVLEQAAKEGCSIFACNAFYQIEFAKSIRPTFYVLGDPVFESDEYIYNLREIFREIVEAYPGVVFLTSQNIGLHLYNKLTPLEDHYCKIYYSAFSWYMAPGKYSFRLDKCIEPYQNVLLLMLQYAIFLGFKKILLYGFDLSNSHDYHKKSVQHAVNKDVYKWRRLPAKISEDESNQKKTTVLIQLKTLLRSVDGSECTIIFG